MENKQISELNNDVILNVEGLKVNYGPIQAVKGINMEVKKGQIVAILGANGAGKTTTLRTISGIIKSSGGTVTFNGEKISNKKAFTVASRGLTQSPEGRLVFNGLSVEDNLKAGGYSLKTKNVKVDRSEFSEKKIEETKRIKNAVGILSILLYGFGIPKFVMGKKQEGLSILIKYLIASVLFTPLALYFDIKGIVEGIKILLMDEENFVENHLLVDKKTAKVQMKENFDRVYRLFPILKERRTQQANTLSGGEQQMLAIGRALMASPKLLLLDEPSLGLAPLIIKDIFNTLIEIKNEGTTILIVEQNALATLKVADYAYVLELGSISLEGPASELINDSRLIDAYLGGKK